MKNFFFLVLVLMMSNASAQKIADSNLSKNAVYVEFLGSAGSGYNISYDRVVFSKGLNHVTVAVGIQPGIKGISHLAIAPQVNYMRGKTHFLETGIGLYRNSCGNKATIVRLGYRYQKHKKFFFKATFTPILTTWNYGREVEGFQAKKFVMPWGGVSFGYAF